MKPGSELVIEYLKSIIVANRKKMNAIDDRTLDKLNLVHHQKFNLAFNTNYTVLISIWSLL